MDKMDIRGKFNITTTIFLSFLIVGIIPIIIVGYVNYNASKRVLEKEIFKKLIAVSDRQGEEIEGYGKEKLRDLEALSKMPSIIKVFEDFNTSFGYGTGSSEYLFTEQHSQLLLKNFKEIYDFHDILFINNNDEIIFSIAKEKDFATNLKTGPYRNTGLAHSYNKAKNMQKASISNLEYYSPSNKPAAFISMPIFSKGKPIGIISIQLTNSEINSVVNNYTGLGKTGETVVGEKAGAEFVFVFNLRHDQNAAFNIVEKMGSANALPMQHALLQESGAGLSLDYRGKKVLAVWKYLPLWKWGMVVKIDASEAFEAEKKYQLFIWGIIIVTLFGIVATAAFISTFISKPIKKLSQVTQSITQGDMDTRAPQIGTNEIGILAMSFNKMADKLVNSIQFHKDEIHEKEIIQTHLNKNAKDLSQVNKNLEGKIKKLNNSRKALFFIIRDTNRISKNLSAVNKELESFSYSVSHDLRSPLRALDGFSRALLEDYADKLDNDGKDYLIRICSAADRMATLIDDLLGLSRITRRRMQIVDINLNQLITPIIKELKKSNPARHADFVINETLMTKGDEHLLQIMMQNLMNNAWKFTARKPSTKITMGVTVIKDKKIFFIRDNGAGFNMEYADKLFGAFQRLHSQKEFEGTGIGLATVQRIINRHGGNIWAEGKVNEGATFYFSLGQN